MTPNKLFSIFINKNKTKAYAQPKKCTVANNQQQLLIPMVLDLQSL